MSATTIHTDGDSYLINESLMQARNKFRKAVSNGDATVHYTSGANDFLVATSHIIAIEGLHRPSEMAEKYSR